MRTRLRFPFSSTLRKLGGSHRRHLVERPGESEERRPLGPPPLEVVR